MADEDTTPKSQTQDTQSAATGAETAPEITPPQNDPPPQVTPAPEDRTELLQRARAFLSSPQVRHEDLTAKRRFLGEKGLSEDEIEGLLREVPAPPPLLPAKTYPQPPPSRLPRLLLDSLRALTWIAGGSAALLLAYFRFIYPRIAQTYQARLSLRTQRKALLERLTNSLQDFKATQQSTFAVLPQPEPLREPVKYRECLTLDKLADASKDEQDIPPVTLLRCAIQECSKGTKKATSAELFGILEEKFPWVAAEGSQHEETLWQTLTNSPLFQPAPLPPAASSTSLASPPPAPSSDTIWTYVPPPPPVTPPLLSSLSTLASTLPTAASSPSQPKFQHTFQALSDLTGYIATQTYAAPHGLRAPGLGLGVPLAPAEEEVRREIRALKGLVLNRRSFMPRPPPAPFARPVQPGAA
ncbi:hypothetical protein TRAPUB_3762 [Trametes pubescens]|uniref:Peroxisome membrane anchor protein Pex14p N-terminal domain-containing protein n=1 Tax=Trametes pubescens TaxID=154538 RepID=A0A1M2VCE3_TRAPU|nr:hypothetical protein TRAPUB_3762 [Trametes pubescens]